ncbi:hypothetical protein J8273_1496 [Carpediemonas membranifera]|uniref:Uncharacterized protein n=1 Tax=Carpediemonas membranifera TaxID=201153 RepID=A0A8J6E1L3_9EUKA|nr:hypothetical protein J8273_1496 [Carpediemonas membranifera]|eukprot:KAG9396504.1 hypothetical protein J8273_1496 [Carpediemonas membranifera]
MLTEALNPRDEEAKDMAQALEPKTLKAGLTGMARWPSEKDIETAILKPKEDGPIEWDVDRDSVKKAEGSFILVSGAHGDEAVKGVPYDKVWDPANQGPITRVAYEQEDGKYRVILELGDTSAWSISRFMEEARDILRLQAPEAPAIWQAAWNKSGIYLKGRTNILGEGEETPLSNEPVRQLQVRKRRVFNRGFRPHMHKWPKPNICI